MASGSKRTTLLTAFQELGAKQDATDGQKDRDATADQGSRYGNRLGDLERDVPAGVVVDRIEGEPVAEIDAGPVAAALECGKGPGKLTRLKCHDVLEYLAQREGHPKRLEIAAGQVDAVPVGDVDLVDLDPGPVQQCVEGAAALAVIAIDRKRRRQAVVDEINCLDGAGGAYVGSAGDRSHALHFAASDVDVRRRERAAAQIGRAGRLCIGVAGAAHRYAGCGRKIYRPGVARLAVYGHPRRLGGIA